MRDRQIFQDEDQPRKDGRAIGQSAGRIAGTRVVAEEMSPEQVRSAGAAEVARVLSKADALAGAGVRREWVAAWTEAAAEAFTIELDRVAAFLAARDLTSIRH